MQEDKFAHVDDSFVLTVFLTNDTVTDQKNVLFKNLQFYNDGTGVLVREYNDGTTINNYIFENCKFKNGGEYLRGLFDAESATEEYLREWRERQAKRSGEKRRKTQKNPTWNVAKKLRKKKRLQVRIRASKAQKHQTTGLRWHAYRRFSPPAQPARENRRQD